MTVSVPAPHLSSWAQREGQGKYYIEKEDIKWRHVGKTSDIETGELRQT